MEMTPILEMIQIQRIQVVWHFVKDLNFQTNHKFIFFQAGKRTDWSGKILVSQSSENQLVQHVTDAIFIIGGIIKHWRNKLGISECYVGLEIIDQRALGFTWSYLIQIILEVTKNAIWFDRDDLRSMLHFFIVEIFFEISKFLPFDSFSPKESQDTKIFIFFLSKLEFKSKNSSEKDKKVRAVPQPKRTSSSSEPQTPSDARRDSKVLNSLFRKAINNDWLTALFSRLHLWP